MKVKTVTGNGGAVCSRLRNMFPSAPRPHNASLLSIALVLAAAGCSPYATIANLGIKVVGDAVDDADVADRGNKLIGRPVAAADAEFGRRQRTMMEIPGRREMITYPVKGDLLAKYRWVVEAEHGRIVALAKMQNDPDGGKDIVKKMVLKEMVLGKTPQEVGTKEQFRKPILTLRDRDTGNMLRVYDVSSIVDFMGARDCVLEFDASGRCQDIWLVGVPASTPGSALGR
ncbi:MAG TPA: hypothetical protein VMV94_06385 [Phycisphaerae bacterium]|nr:hypothetical protein [Phycisphaerae bacterium]